MAKKKIVAEEAAPMEEVKEEVKEDVVPVEITKEKVCEFYGISDDEVFDGDFEKY